MNDAKLQDKGVAALGARRKLLKVGLALWDCANDERGTDTCYLSIRSSPTFELTTRFLIPRVTSRNLERMTRTRTGTAMTRPMATRTSVEELDEH